MATNKNTYDLQTLSKTSVDANEFLEVANKVTRVPRKFQISSLFPTMSTSGAGSEALFVNITNKNQLNFKGIKSGNTSLLTVTTDTNNIVVTALEAGLDLSLCDNTTSNFGTGVDFTGTVTGENAVVNGGTGLSTVAKGALLYASSNDVISATSAMSTNGQLLIGNATNGYPSVATLTAGSNVTITNTAGAISIAASLSTMAADLDMANYDIDLGTGWLSGNGTHEGINIDSDGKVFIGEDTPTAFFESALNIKGSISFDADTPPTIKPKLRASSAGQKVTIEGGSASNSTGGDLDLKGGSSTAGNHNAGDLNLYGGDEAGSGTAGSIKNFVSNGSGAEVQSLTVTGGVAAPNVTVDVGNLIITQPLKGIVHTGSGTVTQITSHSTDVAAINSTSGVITLHSVALAAGAEADFAVPNSTIKTDSVILLTVQSPGASSAVDNASLHAELDEVNSGSMNIRLTNPGAGATSGVYKIHFLVINKS